MLAPLQDILRTIDVLAGELRAVVRRTVTSNVGVAVGPPAMVRQLEDRILLSASPVAAGGDGTSMSESLDDFAAADSSTIAADGGLAATVRSDAPADMDTSLAQVDSANDSLAETRKELLVVDPGVNDYEQIVDGLRRGDTTFEVIVLDASQDGIEQISAVLADQTDLDAIHFVSHGTDGAVKLGNTWLTSENLNAYSGLISGWTGALKGNADLLFYGCDLAGSRDGEELLKSLQAVTGADVAASVDGTGHASLGGDWDLEYAAGSIETAVVVSPQTQDNWLSLLSTFTVTNTNDSGAGSLRQAIIDTNALPGLDEIHFSISAPLVGGAHSIAVMSALPNITDAVLIDGTTDADYVAAPIIELNGGAAGAGTDGLVISGGGTTIRGLVINRFDGAGIKMQTADGNIIEHNYIGVDVTGSVDRGNSDDGIRIDSSNNNRIGGTTVLTRNVISGNDGNGVMIFNGSTGNVLEGNYIGIDAGGSIALRNNFDGLHLASGATNNTIGGTAAGAGNVISGNFDDGVEVTGNLSSNNRIEGNLIGVAANGVTPLGNSGAGVWIEDAPNTVIGGTSPGSRNVIGASGMSGVAFAGSNATGTIVQGNAIGTDLTGTVNVGNAWHGVRFTNTEDFLPFANIGAPSNNTIGGIGASESNTIAFNGKHGISAEVGSSNSLRGNQIYSNGELGIDLNGNNAGNGNDNLDGDSGANELQNFPVLSTAMVNGSDLTVTGTLNSTASSTFAIDFYASSTPDGSGYGEAESYLGSTIVVTDAAGNAAISQFLSTVNVTMGEVVTATATDASGNTSEFALNVATSTSTVLTPNGDTYINNGAIGDNYGNSTSLIVDRSGGSIGDQRALLQFDLSSIPFGATITGATLRLESTQNQGAFDINVYEVTSAWVEGSGNGTADAANWNERQTGINWSTAGGSFDSTAVATLNTGAIGQHSWDLTALVQAWYGGSKVNNGVVIGSPNTGTTKITYDSKEGTTPPELEISYIAANGAPTADAGGPYVVEEGNSLALVGSASTDPDGDPLSYTWDLDNDGSFGEVGEPTTQSPTVNWATLQSFGIDDDGVFTIGLRVDDARGGVDTTTTTVTVNNAAPTLTATGAAIATGGSLYTLNLSATDPGADTITGWTVNWGDGTLEQIAGNPGSITHTYTSAGLTFNITASATDEDGTFHDNELLVASDRSSSLFHFAATSGGFVEEFANADGLNVPYEVAYGPDGNIYVSGQAGSHVLRYDGSTLAFIDAFVTAGSGGLTTAKGIAFGPDGNLYVASYGTDEVLRYDGTTGAFLGAFITAGLGGLDGPGDLLFSSDGRLYVGGSLSHDVLRYDAATGGLIDEFVSAWDGGLDRPLGMVFGPDGNLYVADAPNNVVLRFDGSTGAYLNNFLATGSGGLTYATGVVFGPDGDLYVSSFDTNTVLRFDGTDGSFLGQHVTVASGGLDGPVFVVFTPSHQVTVVAPSNNPPVANSDAYTVNEGATLSVAAGLGVLSNDSDPDTDPLTATLTAGPNYGASFVLNPDGSFTYEHDGSETTNDSFTYEASDGNGGTATATVTLTITPQNDLPIFSSSGTVNVLENTTAVTTVVATDVDVPAQTISYSIVGGADAGQFALGGSVVSFLASPDFEIPADFDGDNVYEVDVQADDGNGGTTVQSISVTVMPANEFSPAFTTVAAVNVAENTTAVLTVNATDADQPVQTVDYSLTGGADAALFTITGATGDLSFLAAPDFESPSDANGNNIYEVDVTADDGNGGTTVQSISVTVTSVNDNNPAFTSPTTANVAENTTTVLAVAATDADNPAQTLTYAITGGADQASFSINSTTGGLTFVMPPNFENSTDANADNVYEVSVRVDDGNGGMDVQLISVTVTDANDTPSSVDISYSISSDQTLRSAAPGVLVGAVDEDADLLTVSLVGGPAHGILTLNPDGSFSYTPNTDFSGTDSFIYQVDDGNGGTDSATVSIFVTSVAFAPPPSPTDDGDVPSNDTPPVSEDAPEESASENPADGEVDAATLLASDATPQRRERTSVASNMTDGLAQPLLAGERTTEDEPLQMLVASSREGTSSRSMQQHLTNNNFDTDSPSDREGRNEESNTATAIDVFLHSGQTGRMWQELDEFHKTLESELQLNNVVVGSVGTIVSGITVGYVLWAVRSGLLLSSVLASLPAWTMFDPLVIASVSETTDDGQEESLEQIVKTQATLAAARSRQNSNTEPTP